MRLSASAIRLARDQHAAAVFVEADTVIAALDHAVNLAAEMQRRETVRTPVAHSHGFPGVVAIQQHREIEERASL
jgi:hypothetical protein